MGFRAWGVGFRVSRAEFRVRPLWGSIESPAADETDDAGLPLEWYLP